MNKKIVWETRKISSIIKRLKDLPILESNQIALAYIDENQKIGIGRDSENQVILILPGQDKVTAFQTKFASFDPWQNLVKLTDNRQLSGVSQLNCNIELNDERNIEALAAIFLGIIDLQIRFNECGEAIWQMKSIFETGFTKAVSESVLTGLTGEILYIISSDDPVGTFDSWHSQTDARYDFSSQEYRLDVKSSSTQKRVHVFRSSQLPGSHPDKTYIVSFLIYRTETGVDLQHIVKELLEKLDLKRQQKAIALIIKTLGVLPQSVSDYFIDFEESKKSLQTYRAINIPSPIEVSGVLKMSWEADLSNIAGTLDALAFFKNPHD